MFPRLLSVSKVIRRALNATSNFRSQAFVRCSSTKPRSPGKFRIARLTVYTLTASGLTLGGALAYANYDPVFKNRVDLYVPGFAGWTDAVADIYVDLVDGVGVRGRQEPKEDSHVGVHKKNVKLGTVLDGKKLPQHLDQKKGERVATSDSLPTVSKAVDRSAEEVGAKAEEDKKTPSSADGKRKDQVLRDTEEGKEVEQRPKEIEAASVELVSEERSSEKVEKGKSEMETVSEQTESVSKEPGKGGEVEEKVKGGVDRVMEEVRGEVERVAGEVRQEKLKEHQEAQDQQFSWLKDSAKVEDKLNEVYEEFVSVTSAVLEAQRGVVGASGRLMKEVSHSSDTIDDLQGAKDTMDTVVKAEEELQTSGELLKETVEKHKSVTHHLMELMDTALELGLKPKVEEVKGGVEEWADRLAEGYAAVKEASTERELLMDYHRQAQRDRQQLERELSLELPEGDPGQELVVGVLGRRVEVLRKRLGEMEREQRERLEAALEKQKTALGELAEKRLEWALQNKDREMQQELSNEVDKMDREYRGELREQLRRQTDTHAQHLAESLQTQAEQLSVKWSQELELKLTEQEAHFQQELARATARLRGFEYMVNTIAAAGNETKRQQAVRAACDSLQTALQSASSCPEPSDHHSLQEEVRNLKLAAKSDPFLVAVLESIPMSGGCIQGEGELRERFSKVKRICRRVALVPETGGGLGTYALSYLQSALMVSWKFVGRIRRRETGDPREMDTFEILDRADWLLQQGEMEEAIRCLNLLQGEPRRVARDWLQDARHFLETTQAVLLASEYLAALNMTDSLQ